MYLLTAFISHEEYLQLLHVRTVCHLSMCCTTIYREPILIHYIANTRIMYQLAQEELMYNDLLQAQEIETQALWDEVERRIIEEREYDWLNIQQRPLQQVREESTALRWRLRDAQIEERRLRVIVNDDERWGRPDTHVRWETSDSESASS